MGFNHCSGECILPGVKVSIPSNPMPKFNFPTKTIKTTTEAVKTFISTTFETFAEENATNSIATTTAAPTIIETEITENHTTIPASLNTETTTVRQVIDTVTQAIADAIDSTGSNETIILNEDNFNNRSIVVGVTDNINNTAILQTMNNESMVIGTDLSSTMENEEISNTISDIVTTVTEKAISTIQTTTEKIMDIFPSTVSAERHHEYDDSMDHMSKGSHSAIYIILGIIIVILLLMFTVLIIIYVRSRKNNSHSLLHHPYYNVSPQHSSSPPTSDERKDNDDLKDVYVQYTC